MALQRARDGGGESGDVERRAESSNHALTAQMRAD